jgi:hypothetical protein
MTAPPSYLQDVTVVSRAVTGRDGYGNDIVAETQQTARGVYAPGSSAEVAAAGSDVVTTQPTVYLPEGVTVHASDVVMVGGRRFQVDGDPRVWPQHPFTGWRPALPVEVALRAATGG